MDVAIVCGHCNYHSRVAAATVAANMLYCPSCGKQIEVALPRRSEESNVRGGGGRKPTSRRPTNRPHAGPGRPAPKRR